VKLENLLKQQNMFSYMAYETLLEEIGLTKGEIKVYLTLLKLGQTTTGKIVQAAGISSGKIYEILDKLIKKGLVSFVIKEKTKYFLGSDPERILDYLLEREEEHQKKVKKLKEVLPELRAFQIETEKKYEITTYQGFKGIQTAAYESLRTLKSGDEITVMGVISRKEKFYNLMWRQWNYERVKRKIKARIIFSDRGSEHYPYFKKMPFTKVKVVQGLTPAAVDIIGKRVLIFTHIEPACIVITSDEIKQSFAQFFETLWKIAKF